MHVMKFINVVCHRNVKIRPNLPQYAGYVRFGHVRNSGKNKQQTYRLPQTVCSCVLVR